MKPKLNFGKMKLKIFKHFPKAVRKERMSQKRKKPSAFLSFCGNCAGGAWAMELGFFRYSATDIGDRDQ